MNKEEFINELKKINIELTKQQLTLLEEYYIILKDENEKYNLTRIIEQNEVYLKHFYDSLTINKIIDIYSQNICDLGSGVISSQAAISMLEEPLKGKVRIADAPILEGAVGAAVESASDAHSSLESVVAAAEASRQLHKK